MKDKDVILINENSIQKKVKLNVLIENEKFKITEILFIDSFETDTDKFHFEQYSGDFNAKVIWYLDNIAGYSDYGIYKEVKNNGLEWILIEYTKKVFKLINKVINLKKLTPEERGRIFEQHITTELVVDIKALGFDNEDFLSNINDVNDYFELPPPVINKETLAQILFNPIPNEEKRQWLMLLFRTYYEGGKILYKKHDNDTYIAKLLFVNNNE